MLDTTKEFMNGLNLYAYCLNNPINDIDSNGSLSWWQWLLVGIGAVLVIAATVVLTIASAGTLTGLAGAVLVGAAKGALVGAAVGTVAGGIIGGATTGWSAGGILSGMAIGFGVGAIAGAVIGGAVGGLSYSPTGLSRTAIKEGINSTFNNSNKINHIMNPKHNLPNSVSKVKSLMYKTLTRGTFSQYKSVSSVIWKNYRVTYNLIEKIIKISNMWFI